MIDVTYAPNSMIDSHLCHLSGGALLVYLCIARLSPIDRSIGVNIGLSKVMQATGISDERTVRKSISELVSLDVFDVVSSKNGPSTIFLTDDLSGGKHGQN